eukprot:CAMPEP_0175311002 /NCGR_PEP_ID=MMETSP0093-20121207/66614_1 /TAXON_ID=311494 /ORGANISM="Alexandrium monilatum, Strain CCMP3105" /LENGTH=79 /DNA_ID=CAMNT_0016607605 /DNA_START=17 /DNA_END=257 /DNA_ORIENTATION=-
MLMKKEAAQTAATAARPRTAAMMTVIKQAKTRVDAKQPALIHDEEQGRRCESAEHEGHQAEQHEVSSSRFTDPRQFCLH